MYLNGITYTTVIAFVTSGGYSAAAQVHACTPTTTKLLSLLQLAELC